MGLDNFNIQGLTHDGVNISWEKFGQNTLNCKQESSTLDALKKLVKKPMIILLLVGYLIYFVSGKTGDGIFLPSAIDQAFDEAHTPTIVFTVLIAATIFLTLVNRTFYHSIFTTLRYKNNLILLIIGIAITNTGLLLFIPPVTAFFEFAQVNASQLFTCMAIGFISLIWYELVIIRTRLKNKINRPGYSHSEHNNDKR